MKDRVVLITGGAGNLGRAVTRAFLDAGARVAVPLHKTDRKDALDSAIGEHGGRMTTFALDLTTERGADAAVRQTVEWAGRLDAVAHLVGGYYGGAFEETPVEAWDRMMDLNARSAYLIARAAVPALLESGDGALVFVGSRAAKEGRSGHAVYAASKGALLTLVEAVAEEYEGRIRVTAVLPETIDTDANRAAMPQADHTRWTPPEEIARVIVALCAPGARVETGAELEIYGPGPHLERLGLA